MSIVEKLGQFSSVISGVMAQAAQARRKAKQARLDAITITPEEAHFVSLALSEFDGAFPVARLAKRAGVTAWRIRTIAQAWAEVGLLTTADFGDSQARQVTPRLAEMARSVRSGG
jgi:hypothetical protein